MIKRCQKCILPENHPHFGFDQTEVCSLCRNSRRPPPVLGKDALLQALRSGDNKGNYDCVIPLSGGKDSTYILYYAVRELQLKPIAVNYDSGFQAPMAKRNIQRACEKLNVPLITKKSRLTKKILKHNFLLLRYGNGFNPCINCEVALRSVSINAAKKHSVPYILWGSSRFESVTDEHYQKFRNLGRPHDRRKRSVAEIASKAAKVVVSPRKMKRTVLGIYRRIRSRCQRIFSVLHRPVGYLFHDWMYRTLIVLQRVRLGTPVKYWFGVGTQVPFMEKPVFIHFFDYIEWDLIRHTQLLKEHLGWEHPEGAKDRFDCLLHCYINFIHLRTTGLSHDGLSFCHMLRKGKVTREEALSKEKHTRAVVRNQCEEIADFIGIDRAYLQEHKIWESLHV